MRLIAQCLLASRSLPVHQPPLRSSKSAFQQSQILRSLRDEIRMKIGPDRGSAR
ncbi:hypothetical protein PR003_g18344 [Phytophthora rubi]|uniref:Uncharacterized protein n=1 Tax=Phytophthora rubi TaxID=129364 RepID=A0A6A3KKA2_9STRA|nr:hypothetical protein PR002_g18393 [Phytophthora rubi]KAE9004154.1 hypothetical protein PR001_g17786 [Phytophthora rubi]KAE9317997.1 hypothetical protein PR003_g18344 [Phytophthora rubi]